MSPIFQQLSDASRIAPHSAPVASASASRSKTAQVRPGEEVTKISREVISSQKVKEFLESQLQQKLRMRVDTSEHRAFAEIVASEQALQELGQATSRYGFVETLRRLARNKIISPANPQTGTPEQRLLFTREQRQELLDAAKKLYPKEPEIGRIWA